MRLRRALLVALALAGGFVDIAYGLVLLSTWGRREQCHRCGRERPEDACVRSCCPDDRMPCVYGQNEEETSA